VTQDEIPLFTDIAGVNMCIDSGAFRELHWHTADEWAYMLTGSARSTLLPKPMCSSPFSKNAGMMV
jgi:oxalate decarboxylase